MSAMSVLWVLAVVGQTDAADDSLRILRDRARETRLSFVGSSAEPQFEAAPVFRYSDQLRHIRDAGIWIWTQGGRPVAALKVEHYEPGVHPRPWLYCFASLSTELAVAEWTRAATFRAREPGVSWQSLGDKPANSRAARLLQMREIARRFSAELVRRTDVEERTQMRLLPRPLFRYAESAESAVDGAVFGFTGTGTNPDLLLLLDLTVDEGWRFGFAGMTAEGLVVQLGDKTVWEFPHTAGKGHVFDTWTYFCPND